VLPPSSATGRVRRMIFIHMDVTCDIPDELTDPDSGTPEIFRADKKRPPEPFPLPCRSQVKLIPCGGSGKPASATIEQWGFNRAANPHPGDRAPQGPESAQIPPPMVQRSGWL